MTPTRKRLLVLGASTAGTMTVNRLRRGPNPHPGVIDINTTNLDSHQIHVDDEGFPVEPGEWSDEFAPVLAAQIGVAEATIEESP